MLPPSLKRTTIRLEAGSKGMGPLPVTKTPDALVSVGSIGGVPVGLGGGRGAGQDRGEAPQDPPTSYTSTSPTPVVPSIPLTIAV